MSQSSPVNVLRTPLNGILGSRANVRLLRVLCIGVDGSLSASDAASRAGLTAVGARKALEQLVKTGVVTRKGSGRPRQYEANLKSPLSASLRALFEEEYDRCREFMKRLRDIVVGVPELRSVWIESLPADFDRTLDLVVVSESVAIPWIRGELRAQLVSLESDSDQVIEFSVYTRADAPKPGAGATHLLITEGTHPRQNPSPGKRTERALRLSTAVADLLSKDPSLIKRALRHINQTIHDEPGIAISDLIEWKQILESYSVERIRDLLVSESSRAVRLRQSSPFFAVLTSEERNTLLQDYESQDDS